MGKDWNPWKSAGNSAQFLFMIRMLFSLIYLKPQTKYETAQPSSASAFELIPKDAFKSHIALRIIRRSQQTWITMTKYCCDLAINSSPITGKQNVLFCYWWLPLHPKTKKEKNNHNRFRWTLTKTILHLGIYEHLFISSPSCVDFISFH